MKEPAIPSIVWSAPLFDRSGFADEARQFILALDQAGFDVRADPFLRHPWQVRLPGGAGERIERLLAAEVPSRFVHVVHGSPHDLRRHPRAAYAVARTMFETQDAPAELAACDDFDEIWVPSPFNVETFARAGIDRARLHAVPEPIDTSRYDPAPPPLPLAGLEERFVFLSVFSWHLRKGWDALVRAYRAEFSADEPVTLALKFEPYLPHTPTVAEAHRRLQSYVEAELRGDLAQGPPIVLLDLDLSDADLPRLYRAADAYVMASRGEGWGRPYLEAMAAGLPTIGTRAGGNLAFMHDDNAYLVDTTPVPVPALGWEEVPWYRGHRWAEPSIPQLRAAMRRVFEERDEAAARGARAREEILARYGWERIAACVKERLREAGVAAQRAPAIRPRVAEADVPRVVWEGDFFREHSFAVVNRELCRALLGTGGVDLALRADPAVGPLAASPALAGLLARCDRAPRDPDVHVRH
ncbi:MAG: glycosyltransferase, partial [Myxococcota bacterium]|nr:glycosyltransferase [Myxococcota bacterium]